MRYRRVRILQHDLMRCTRSLGAHICICHTRTNTHKITLYTGKMAHSHALHTLTFFVINVWMNEQRTDGQTGATREREDVSRASCVWVRIRLCVNTVYILAYIRPPFVRARESVWEGEEDDDYNKSSSDSIRIRERERERGEKSKTHRVWSKRALGKRIFSLFFFYFSILFLPFGFRARIWHIRGE